MRAAVTYRVEVFAEGDQFVGLCPELGVSSFGNTEKEAEDALHEAVRLFMDQCEEMGTLAEVLEEAGFRRDRDHNGPGEKWLTREPVKLSTAEA